MSSPPGPVLFWRELPSHPYNFMSQWYSSPFVVEGTMYHNAEMWMMVSKARLFGDEDIAGKMMLVGEDPRELQRLGRMAKGFDRGKWDECKSRIVEEGNWYKFKDNAELRGWLLETGDREIVEASPKDRVWGIGFGAEDAEANRERWGENRLGIALMSVRERLRKEGVS